jgi:hypothetical protein
MSLAYSKFVMDPLYTHYGSLYINRGKVCPPREASESDQIGVESMYGMFYICGGRGRAVHAHRDL